jgi:hypothetical protein
MQASLDLEYSRSMLFFTWAGSDKMNQVSGAGWLSCSTAARSGASSHTISVTTQSASSTHHFFNNLLDRCEAPGISSN